MTRAPGTFARSLRFVDDDPVAVIWEDGDPLTCAVHWISSRVNPQACFAVSIDAETTPIFWSIATWDVLQLLDDPRAIDELVSQPFVRLAGMIEFDRQYARE